MPYSSNAISHASQYSLSATMTGGVACACTIITIKSTGATSSEITTSPNGNRSVPNGASRMIFIVHGPASTQGTFTVSQGGGQLYTAGFTADHEVTFEVT